MAVKAFREKLVNRIILTRPAVEAEPKDLVSCLGDLQNKVDPYLRPPVRPAVPYNGAPKHTKQPWKKGVIEVAPLAYMGRTLDDSFIILDGARIQPLSR